MSSLPVFTPAGSKLKRSIQSYKTNSVKDMYMYT